MKAFLAGLRRPAAIAHRGGARAYPENTLVAFEAALGLQMDVLELDVHLSRDGVLVVAHDPTVDRCTNGSGPISSLTVAELKALDAGFRFDAWRGKGVTIPTLDEVLAAFPSTRLNIELKHVGPEALLLETLSRRSALERVCIGSEHDPVAEKLAALAPQVCRFYPANAALQLAMSVWSGEELALDARYDVLEVPREYGGEVVTTKRFFDACGALPVFVWVVDEEAHMRELIRDGAAGVMTDLPAVLHAVMR